LDSIFPANPLAEFRAEHKAKVTHILGAASPDALSLSELLTYASEQELNSWHDLKLGYSPAGGSVILREQIAQNYSGLDAEHIVTFAGAQEAIFAVYHALLSKDDLMQAISPHFGPLHLVAEGLDAKVDIVNLDFNETGEWSLDVDHWCQRLLFNARGNLKLAAINFPHNPTGAMLNKQQLDQMVAACSEQGCWLFSDEVFRGLEYDKQDQLPPVASLYERGISLGVVSKSHGLGGVRVGWIACKNKSVLKRLLEIKEYLSICNGISDEMLALIALRNSDQILEKNRQQAQKNLQILESNRTELVHLKWAAPKAGVLLYPQLIDRTAADDFVLNMLEKTGTLVLPGHCFGEAINHFRIGYGRDAFNWQALTVIS